MGNGPFGQAVCWCSKRLCREVAAPDQLCALHHRQVATMPFLGSDNMCADDTEAAKATRSMCERRAMQVHQEAARCERVKTAFTNLKWHQPQSRWRHKRTLSDIPTKLQPACSMTTYQIRSTTFLNSPHQVFSSLSKNYIHTYLLHDLDGVRCN